MLTKVDADLSLVAGTAGDHHPHAAALLRRISAASRRGGAASGLRLLGVSFASASSEYLTVGNDASIDNLTAITVSFWNDPANLTPEQCVIHKGVVNAGWRIEKVASSGFIKFTWERATGDFTCQTDSSHFVLGEVRHILVTADSGADSCAIHVDGIAVAITTVVGSGTYSLGGTAALEVGRLSNASLHYDGWVHELRFYDAVLGAADIASLASLPNPLAVVAAGDLQMHLPLNEVADGKPASGVAFFDRTANDNDANAINTPTGDVREYDAQDHD